MQEGHRPYRELIEELERGVRPLDKFVARSLSDIFLSGKFAYLHEPGKTGLEEPVISAALRFVALRGDRVESMVISDGETEDVITKLRKGLNGIYAQPVSFELARDAAYFFRPILEKSGLIVYGAIALTRVLRTNEEQVNILFPKPLSEAAGIMSPFVPQSIDINGSGRGLAAASISLMILKGIPFGNNPPLRIKLPSA